MDRPFYMVFDVESLGLHGKGFSVGWVLIDRTGKEMSCGRADCDPDAVPGQWVDRQWVAAHVPAPPDGYTTRLLATVRDVFWDAWRKAAVKGAWLVADCPWPVETNFLRDCVADDSSRGWTGPYPLIDVGSVRLAAGLDALGTSDRLANELPIHDPLCDARQSARLLIEALDSMKAGGK